MTTEQFKEFFVTVPPQPGVYRFLDERDTILYVGKAKNLRQRLAAYFGDKKHLSAKTKALIRHARRIEFTLVDTEADALLLENTLIKKHQPRYNVMLKDEKSPLAYVCIKAERFPRVLVTRRVSRDGSTYFGPYLNKNRIDQITDLIRRLFQLRSCSLHLSEKNIANGKFKPCLEYHIKNCAAPCAGYETEEAYNRKIEQVKNILRGHFGSVKAHLKEEMQRYAENLQFEQAQQVKEKLALFEDYQGRSTVVNPNIRDVDVFSIVTDEEEAYVHCLRVVNGAIINTYTLTLTKNLDDDPSTLLSYALVVLRQKMDSTAPEIIVPFPVAAPEGVVVTVPKIGDKKKLLDLSERNARQYQLQQRRTALNRSRRQTQAERILNTLKADLQLKELPLHIECFDNSNLQGAHPVSSCVVFRQAKPARREYRHYHVKSVEGPNDFASMEEVVYRRYKRLLAEGQSLPQLVIIDGGKGQLSAAMKSLRALGLEGKIAVIGIAKRLEEIYFPDDPVPLHLNKKSESLRLIQQARNEAHRFAIAFHRNKRSRSFLHTELVEIPGIGPKTAEKLLQHFGSVTRIRQALEEEIAQVIGKAQAARVVRYFSSQPVDEEANP